MIRIGLSRALAVFVVVVGLAACQPLPRPFAHDGEPQNSLLDLAGGAGIVVRPIAGVPGGGDRALAGAMAAALRDANVPAATAGGNTASLTLKGDASSSPSPDGRVNVTVIWSLIDAKGMNVGAYEQAETVSATDWQAGSAALMSFIASKAAGQLALSINGPPTAPSAAASPPKLVVWPVDGAPGDGSRSLSSAMTSALRRAGVEVRPVVSDQTFVLLGSVRMGAIANGLQPIAITWTIILADGTQIGDVEQENSVPAHSLETTWGAVALAVADNAAPAIATLLHNSADEIETPVRQ